MSDFKFLDDRSRRYGTLIGRINIGETVANVCFGRPKKNRLFICASTSLYEIYLNARGAQFP